ncbi:hypothetical protein CEK25_012339 [Fusarium fujikuroi]|nr:hypothetical protein CEK25_012339 [Fusarium fujikuroi]
MGVHERRASRSRCMKGVNAPETHAASECVGKARKASETVAATELSGRLPPPELRLLRINKLRFESSRRPSTAMSLAFRQVQRPARQNAYPLEIIPREHKPPRHKMIDNICR